MKISVFGLVYLWNILTDGGKCSSALSRKGSDQVKAKLKNALDNLLQSFRGDGVTVTSDFQKDNFYLGASNAVLHVDVC